MAKRALTCYDIGCWPDQLSFAQEMRESQVYIGVNNAEVAGRFDEWRKRLTHFLQAEGRTQEEQVRLGHPMALMSQWRPGLVQCYDLPGFPRTNNEMGISSRVLKTRARRISGRKPWNVYTARARVAVWPTHEWWMQQPNGATLLQARWQQTPPHLWRAVRHQTRQCHGEQLNRFRHDPPAFLASLEQRWEQAACP